jgi:hypothetical protein
MVGSIIKKKMILNELILIKIEMRVNWFMFEYFYLYKSENNKIK